MANTTGRKLNWNQLWEARLLDSMDYTVYTWENGDYVGFNPYSGSTADASLNPMSVFGIRLSNLSKPPLTLIVRVEPKPVGISKIKPIISQFSSKQDTVHFGLITSGAYGAAYKASLFIDSAYKNTLKVPCWD